MSNSDDVRLIDANKLKAEAYRRFGLSAIKFNLLIDEQETVSALPIEYGDKSK